MIIGYICRHGQTEWNLKAITQGWKDSPLTKLGIDHAKDLSLKVSGLKVNKIISSDLERASETARIINANLNKRIYFEPKLREISCGIYDGKPDEILIKENPGFTAVSYQFLKGESAEMLIKRLLKFFNNFENKYGKEPFLIVSHQGVIKAIMLIAGKLDEKDFYFKKISHESIGKLIIEDGKLISFEFI